MEQLVGTNVQVVLSLKEGKGFQRIANPTCIVSTLNGQSLETDFIESDSNPCYSTDLVWKADKYSLRKMRSGQEPLKIECFEIKENGKRDKIGYVLLSLRSARIILPKDIDSYIPSTWHRLLGLRNDIKIDKPELSLALTIEDHETYIRRVSREEVTSSKDGIRSNFSITDFETAVPYFIEKENLIQLGPIDTCNSLFLLNIITGEAKNLHLLKQETDKPSNDDYSLCCRFLETEIRLKSFSTLEERFEPTELALARIRSSPNVLRNYFCKKPNFLLTLQRGDAILGRTEVDLRPLIAKETIKDSQRYPENTDTVLNHRCVLIGDKPPSSIRDNEDNRVSVDLQLNLRYIEAEKMAEQRINAESDELYREECPGDNTTGLYYAFSEIDAHRNPRGDFGTYANEDRRMYKSLYTDTSNVGNERIQMDRIPTASGNITATDSRGAQDYTKSLEAYHCYCLNVNMIGIKLSSSSVRNIEFRFHHPKAEIMSTLYPNMPLSRDEKLRLQDIGCKLHFISSSNEIRHLLMSFPPKVSIRDVGSEAKTCIGQAILDVALLFHQHKQEIKYEALLYDCDKNVIGTLDVAMHLEDRGPYYKSYKNTSDENFGPPIIDDSLAYKIVDELETWKEHQQEIFRVELKRREERYLNRLSDEWQQRREKLESKLACSVEQCKILANSLNKATEDLRTRRLKSLEKEARLIKANEDLQWRYENNMLQVQEASRRLQEEHLSKINSLEERRNVLETENESLRSENESLRSENDRLRRSTSEQEEEIRAYQKGSLTQDQVASLLQDVKALEQKLNITQNDKAFFKEEWGKAVREIHRMKIEHQQAIGLRIKANKEELKNFDLEDVLCADSTALSNDQILLGQIQKEIDVIKPISTFLRNDAPTSQRSLTPLDVQLYPRKNSKPQRGSAKSEQQDERLRKLIEERDALLKTGSYTNDDIVIVKLNNEIKSLLITN